MTKIKCPVCGKANKEGTKYCTYCDATIKVVSAKYFKDSQEAGVEKTSTSENMDSRSEVNEIHSTKSVERHIKSHIFNNQNLTEDDNPQMNEPNNQSENELNASFIKLNHLECPFCGNLSKQNQFFCQLCGCDLKFAQTIKVPVGKLDEYQERHKKNTQKLLVSKSKSTNPDVDLKAFLQLGRNRNLPVSSWKLAKEVTFDAGGNDITKKLAALTGIAYVLTRFILPKAGSGLFVLIFLVIPLIRKSLNKDNNADLSVVLNEKMIEVWEKTGKKNNRLRFVKWDDIDFIRIVASGNKKQIVLEGKESFNTCILPFFSHGSRHMIFNTLGILAIRKGYNIIDDTE